jgi:hypothetical protein
MRAMLVSKAVSILLLVLVSTTILARANAIATAAQTVDDYGCDAPLPDVLATVNGAKISRQDLSSATESRIKQKEEVITARKREVDLLVSP